jgi:uncharacterized protein YfaS (alpha-2-macroglobulin family)
MTCATFQQVWDVGDEAEFGLEVRDARETPALLADPTLLTFRALRPDGTEVTRSWPGDVERISVGRFRTAIALNQAGRWTVRWKGTGAIAFAEERQVTVRASAFSNP